MSVPLKDGGRLLITAETFYWLESECEITGEDRVKLVRDILHAHAMKEIHRANLVVAKQKANGLAWSVKESDRGNPGIETHLRPESRG